MTNKMSPFLFGLAAMLAIASTGHAQGTKPQAVIAPEHDPVRDIIDPGTARWFYLGSLLVEAPTWSAAVNGCFGLSGNKATAIQLLVSPASFFGFLWTSRHRQITAGMSAASWYGTWHGFGVGYVVGDLLYDWGQPKPSLNPLGMFGDPDPDPRLGAAVAGSVAGHIVALRHAERERLNLGNVEMLSQAGLWSGLYAGYLMALPLPWGDTSITEKGVPWRTKLVEAAALAGWCAGIKVWNDRAPRDYTTGDAISTWNSNAMGTLTAVAAGYLLPSEWWNDEWSGKGASLLPALVNAGGLAYGYWFHRGRDVTFAQSLLVSLGTTLGASSIGAAVALFATPEDQAPDTRLSLVTAAAGGWGGFHLTHMLLDTDKPAQSRADAGHAPLRVSLMPANALGVLLAAKANTRCRVPLLCAEF